MKSQQLDKMTLHNELQRRYREYFESKFAEEILNHPHIFTSVRSISNTILRLMETHSETIIKAIQNEKKMNDDLYHENSYGRLEGPATTAKAIFTHMKDTLTNTDTPLIQTMQLHAVFSYRLYKYIQKHPSESKKTDEPSYRMLSNRPVQVSKQFGICKNPVFMKMFKPLRLSHVRGVDRFTLLSHSPYFKQVTAKNTPFATGPSGHTRTMLSGIVQFGNLTPQEVAEYSLAIFAFLASGGHHTFQEVMMVATHFGVPFIDNQYSPSLPESFKATETYRTLCALFPEFLDAKINDCERIAPC